jgi:hypothetical protein
MSLAFSILLLLSWGAACKAQLPAQPIDFQHRIHAGVNQIPCQYCHTSARRSDRSGIPSVDRCLGCHKVIALDNPEVMKLQGYAKKGEAVPWVRIFATPEFAYFRHYPHIQADIKCQTCHGPVETMDRFRERPFIEMGFCIECHRKQKRAREITDCYTCHR